MRLFVFFGFVSVGVWVPLAAGEERLQGGLLRASAGSAETANYQALFASQELFQAVAAGLKPYLVRIETVGGAQPRQFVAAEPEDEQAPRPQRSQNPFRDAPGSGFVVADGPTTGIIYSSDGYIIASSFNFVREPALISITLADGRRFAADLTARDQVRKLALLKIDATGLAVPLWAPPTDIRVGQWAVALGLGFGGDEPSVTVGIVSALNRMRGNAIQTDAKLSPANYGGPLCDVHGRVIGICVPLAERPGELAGVEMYDSGVGFALPKPRVDEIVGELRKGNSFYRGWLGIEVKADETESVVIGRVADPSPMRAAGVRPGDKILGAAGREVHHFGHMVQALYMIPAGQEVYLHLERSGLEFGISVKLARNSELGPLPDAPEPFDPANPQAGPEEE